VLTAGGVGGLGPFVVLTAGGGGVIVVVVVVECVDRGIEFGLTFFHHMVAQG
jgi:hypothetical protein